jgi:spermidine/putrescine transport system permease protein
MPQSRGVGMAISAHRGFSVRKQPGFAAVAMFCFVLLYLPIVVLVVFAFNGGNSLAVWEGFSLRWFQAAWHNQQVQEAAVRSLFVAFVAATVSTACAALAALATTRTAPYRGLTFKYAFINQPLMIPEIVTAVSLLIVFSRIKVWTGYSGIGYLHSIRLSAHSRAA